MRARTLAPSTVVTLAVLLVPLLAGCLGGLGPEGTDPAGDAPGADGGGAADAVLDFLAPVDLTCAADDPRPSPCGRFGEPVMEVQGDGTIWASATCCIGQAPPIWTSRDGGQTFDLHEADDAGPTEWTRQAYGIEGDFAVDDAGNVFFFDIALGATWFTAYDADGNHRHTVAHPAPPLVDRPWVRAGAEDEVFIVYNTARSTWFFPSADGGLTLDYAAGHEFPCSIGTPGQGPTRDDLFVAASCGGTPRLWTSDDRGATWSDGEAVPVPGSPESLEFVIPPVADEDGWIYVPLAADDGEDKAVLLARRAPDGTWLDTVEVLGEGRGEKPWAAAGAGGAVAVAFYHADVTAANESEAQWHLKVATTTDARAAEPTFQVEVPDDEVLADGAWSRSLGDFLQVEVLPDGRIGVVYGKNRADSGYDILNRFVASDDGRLADAFAPATYLNGP